MNETSYKLGITKSFPCNYLTNKQERLLIAIDDRLQNTQSYTWLMTQGFRRSGDQSYRPHCPNCNSCQSIRVLVNEFCPSKSQKRTMKRNNHLIIKRSVNLKDNYYPLYENYINTCHQDGSMFPANFQQFKSFLSSKLTKQMFIETWLETDIDTETSSSLHVEKNKQLTLVCVAVTDVLVNALSAVYTFYHPKYKAAGLGVFSILTQIETCQQLNLPYLYLGYQIDSCQKMNYKNRYVPYEKFVDDQWLLFKKTITQQKKR